MDLRKISFFVVLAEIGSFTKAALALRISQPSLSHAIKKLEENAGVQLLERTKRHVILTEAGKQFYEIAKEFLQHHDTLLKELETIKEIGTGTISIGMIEAVKNWIPQVIGEHQEFYAEQKFELYEILSPSEMLSSIKSYETHLCISNYKTAEEYASCVTLYEEEFVLVANPDYFGSALEEISISDLEGHPLILSPNKYLTQQNILQAFSDAKVKPNIKLEVERFETACSCVEAGLGVTFVPKNFILYSRFNQLQTIKPTNPTPVRSVYLLYNKNRKMPESVIRFIKLCKVLGEKMDRKIE